MLVSSVTLCTTAAAVHCGIRQSHDPPRAQLHHLTSFRDGACVPARPDPLAALHTVQPRCQFVLGFECANLLHDSSCGNLAVTGTTTPPPANEKAVVNVGSGDRARTSRSPGKRRWGT